MMLRNLLLTTAFTMLATLPAEAGFTLINPPATTTTVTMPAAPSGPITETTIIDGVPPAPVAQPLTTSKVTTTLVAPMPATAPRAAGSQKAVHGFGKQIPLIIAVRQIAPEDAQIALADGVNPQQPISWKGGSDWHNVLNSALSPQGLAAVEQGNILVIGKTGASDKITAAAMPAPTLVSDTTFSKASLSPRDAAPPMVQKVTVTQPATKTDITTTVAQPASMAPVPLQPSAAPVIETTTTVAQPVAIETLPPVVEQPAPMTAAMDTTVTVAPPSALPVSTMTPVTSVQDSGLETWRAKSGTMLHEILTEWTKHAGVTLRWDTEYDYPLQTAVSIDGDFEGAVRTLLRGFNSAQPQPVAKLFHGKDMPAVLLVTERGNDIATVK